MTEFENSVTGYEQVGAQYAILKCANVRMILIPYINNTVTQMFYNGEMVYIKAEKMPMDEIITTLTKIGWEVCA